MDIDALLTITIQPDNYCNGGNQRMGLTKARALPSAWWGAGKAQLPEKVGEGGLCAYLFLLLTVSVTVVSFLLFE